MKPACKDCRFWEAHGQQGMGYCHRNPPIPIMDQYRTVQSYLAECDQNWWCGEFRPPETHTFSNPNVMPGFIPQDFGNKK